MAVSITQILLVIVLTALVMVNVVEAMCVCVTHSIMEMSVNTKVQI